MKDELTATPPPDERECSRCWAHPKTGRACTCTDEEWRAHRDAAERKRGAR